MEKYSITYELDGGMSLNPTSYAEDESIRLKAPLRPGYVFEGWQGSPSVIPMGSRGDRTFTARWKSIDLSKRANIRSTVNFGIDDGLEHKPSSLSVPVGKGTRGEDLFLSGTVYTDINVDGERDAAYDYGLHFRSDVNNNPEYYADKDTGFDVYVVRAQNGLVYVFAEITDPYVVAPDELWRANCHHADGFHVYVDYGFILFGADPSGKKIKNHIGSKLEAYKIVLTDKGYNIEFAMNNVGGFYSDGDQISLSFFMADCVSYESVASHKKNVLRCSSALSGREKYKIPCREENDSIVFSLASASGKELAPVTEIISRTDDIIADIISGARRTAIVYGKNASAYTIISLREIATHLNSFCAPITVISENSDIRGSFDIEILVGTTDDSDFMALANKAPYSGYALELGDDKIMIVGWLEDAFDKAIGLFNSAVEYVRRGGRLSELDRLYIGDLGSLTNEKIPRIEKFNTVTDAGDGAYCILVKPASEEQYVQYGKRLVGAGFDIYTENEMNTLVCQTYYDDRSVITLTYDRNPDNGNDMRVVIEPRAMTEFPPLEVAEYSPVCKSSITQIHPNRMTYVVKLDNGEFLIADSGTNKQHSYIYDELMRLSDDGKPVVALWTFSHFHQDHNGGFVEFVQNEEYMKKVTVKAVLYNTPEQQLISLASKLDQKNMSMWESLLDRHGIKRYQARTGQKYRLANVELEILYTYEDLMPFFVYHDRSNPSSFVYSMKIEGQRFIITGDCCSEASKLMVARYSDTLKSDFVQLPHHGHGDGGTDPMFYEKVNADYILWPGEPQRLSPAEAGAIKKVKKYFVMCEGTVTLDLPYKG